MSQLPVGLTSLVHNVDEHPHLALPHFVLRGLGDWPTYRSGLSILCSDTVHTVEVRFSTAELEVSDIFWSPSRGPSYSVSFLSLSIPKWPERGKDIDRFYQDVDSVRGGSSVWHSKALRVTDVNR